MARLAIAALWIAIYLMAGCSAPYTSGDESSYGEEKEPRGKVRAEAYLFDARVYRDGKPTSFRLQLFQTDTIIGIGGRGYLGKGALKGWMRDDSLKIYFPATGEFVYESVSSMLNSLECAGAAAEMNFVHYFAELPVGDAANALEVRTIEIKKKRQTFSVRQAGCDWELLLTYDLKKKGWRIRSFEFDDGDKFRLKAKRREYKGSARVERRKFQVVIPPSAIRITP